MTLTLCAFLAIFLKIPCPLPAQAATIVVENCSSIGTDVAVTVMIPDGALSCDSESVLSLSEAAAMLESAGIHHWSGQTCSVISCDACSCPSGVMQRFTIDEGCLEAAIALGFQRSSDPETCI